MHLRITILLSLLLASGTTSLTGAAARLATEGESLFTQFSFFQEDERYVTTNYRSGTLVPINTEVKFIRSGGNQIHVSLVPSGADLVVINVKQYSGMDTAGIFNRMLARNKVDLSQYTDTERRNILLGSIAFGMSKESVIRAIGYPPVNWKTPMNADRWEYSSSQIDSFVLTFQDEKLINAQPPHHYSTGNSARTQPAVTRERFVVRADNTKAYNGDTAIALLPKGALVNLIERNGNYRLIEFMLDGQPTWGWVLETEIRIE